MNRVYEHRLRPTKKQEQALLGVLSGACQMYNNALAEWKEHWKQTGKYLSRFTQDKRYNKDAYLDLPAVVVDTTLARLHNALNPDSMMKILLEHREREAKKKKAYPQSMATDLVFTSPRGNPIPPCEANRWFRQLLVNAGLRLIRLHDLRHTSATILLKQGVHPKVVQERLGHANISITLDTYSHILPGMQEEATRKLQEALKLL